MAKPPVPDCLRLAIATFFVLHFFISVLLDAQAIAPFKYPELLQRVLLEWHIEPNGDFLMAESPIWYVMAHCIILPLPC